MYRKSKWKMFLKPNILIKQLIAIIRACGAYFYPWEKNFYKLFTSSIRLYLKEGFKTKEIFRLGLFCQNRNNELIDKFISRKKLLQMQYLLNHPSWHEVAYNKGIFYNYAGQLNLPIPELYALFFKGTAGWSYRKPIIASEEEWIAFIREELPIEFVVKPCRGSWGEDIDIFTKAKVGLLDGLGKYQNESDIFLKMMSNKKYDSFIMQERLRNHKQFFELSSSDYIHCVRIITLIDSTGQFKILHGQLNLVTGEGTTSQGGDLKISISPEDGVLIHGFLLNKTQGGFSIITEHPETRQNFKGFKLPLWDEVLSLSKEAAYKFLPLRTNGWDFAITDSGVKLIEANAYYGVPWVAQMSNFIKNLTDTSKIQKQR